MLRSHLTRVKDYEYPPSIDFRYIPWMDIVRHVRFFVAVSDQLHFGHAADELGMAQPPLSQGIARLERHLGVRLFDRDARRVQLTAAGADLLPTARRLLADADSWVASGRAWRPRATLRFGIADDLLEGWGYVLQALAQEGWNPMPVVKPSTTLVHLAREGEVDVALVRHPVITDGLLTGEVVSAPAHLECADPSTPANDLPVAVPPRGAHPPAHDQLVDALARSGHPATVVELETAQERRAWVAAGRAAALVATPRPPGPPEPPGPHPIEIRLRLVTGPLSVRRSGLDVSDLMGHLQELL